MSVADRFFAKVNKDGPVHVGALGPCWEWTATTTCRGYGQFWLNGKYEQAHRVAWMLHTGAIPSLDVLHHCDNRKCVRSSHLFLGDARLNAMDKVAKGRQIKGEAVNTAKLTESDVQTIREALKDGESQTALAARFNVTQANVSEIARGRTWKHLLQPAGCS